MGIHPEEGVSTVEVVYTRLHAGGKFDKKAGGAYQFSGGLHGVGVSVTNALSRRLEVAVTREGGVHRMAFAGGDVVEPLTMIRSAPKRASGTSVRVWPDAQYFDSAEIPPQQLERVLKAKAVLLPGVRVRLEVEDRDGLLKEEKEWVYQDGLSDYLKVATVGIPGGRPVLETGQIRPGLARHLRRGRGRGMGGGLDGRRADRARVLRQPDPHALRRHP